MEDLETTINEKVTPLLEETMEKNWGITIPQIESDITDKLKNPLLEMYIPANLNFQQAKKFFRSTFLKKELKLHQGNISQLAKTLDIDRRSIHRAIKELDINLNQVRTSSPLDSQEEMVEETIRSSLEQYKGLIQPQQMEKIYQEVPRLSRNIAKVLPHQDITWKQAERDFEKQFLSHALKDNGGNVSQTAKKLNIRAETLHRKIKKLSLK